MDKTKIEGMLKFLRWQQLNELLNGIRKGDLFNISEALKLTAVKSEDIGFYPGAEKKNGKIDLSKVTFLVSENDNDIANISVYIGDNAEVKVRARDQEAKMYIPSIKEFFNAKVPA